MKSYLYLLILIIFPTIGLYSQEGGKSTFRFLNLTNSARIAGTGGDFLPANDNDISLALSNPSIINNEMNNHLALNYVGYYSDIRSGFATYSRTIKRIGSFTANLQFLNYGSFTRTDESGTILGEFSASEQSFVIGWGRHLDSSFSIGANLKSMFSNFDEYRSMGIAVDVAATYHNPDRHFTAVIIAKNIGKQLKSYTSENSESMPFEMQAGCYIGFANAPIRLSFMYNNIEKFDLTYDDPNNPDIKTDPLTGETIEKNNISESADKLMRHIVIGAEFVPVKAFSFRLGYNYDRRKQLGLDSKMSLTGFSWGLGIKMNKISIDFSRAKYHLSGSPNNITLSTNLSNFFPKKSY